jgi:hypothetical protein
MWRGREMSQSKNWTQHWKDNKVTPDETRTNFSFM